MVAVVVCGKGAGLLCVGEYEEDRDCDSARVPAAIATIEVYRA